MDDTAAIRHLVKSANLPATLEAEMLEDESVQAKLDHLANATELSESATLLQTALREIQERRLTHCVYNEILRPRIPKFLYIRRLLPDEGPRQHRKPSNNASSRAHWRIQTTRSSVSSGWRD